jgi:hypothetical protein
MKHFQPNNVPKLWQAKAKAQLFHVLLSNFPPSIFVQSELSWLENFGHQFFMQRKDKRRRDLPEIKRIKQDDSGVS